MAEKNEVGEIPIVSNELQSGHNNDQKSGEDQFDLYIQNVIYKFVNHLSENEISGEARRQFCTCVNSIIKAYEGKLQELKLALKNVVQDFKTRNHLKNQEIRQLRRTITKLRKQLDSTCEECKKKITTEDLSSLSVQDKTKSPTPSETEVDGRAGENVDFYEGVETSIVAAQKLKFPFVPDIRCPVATCGLVALLCLFNKKEIYFCPTKFILKFGGVTRHLAPSCTKILQNLKELRYLTRVYKCEQINEGEHGEVLKTAQDQLRASQQEVGLLSYSTGSYNHCVTVYITVEGEMRIDDAHLEIDYIEDLDQARSLEIIVLRCDNNGEPLIVKKWGGECHRDICINEFDQLSKHENNKNTSSLSISTLD